MGINASCGATPHQNARVLMAGLDTAGKTTILYRLLLGETVSALPTIGFNVETLKTTGLHMTIWDVGGNEKLIHLWKHYTAATQALIYVVDSTDREKLVASRKALHNLLASPDMDHVPLIVLANKQDQNNAMTTNEIAIELQITNLSSSRQCNIQGTCATTGEGLKEAMTIVTSHLITDKQASRR